MFKIINISYKQNIFLSANKHIIDINCIIFNKICLNADLILRKYFKDIKEVI